MTETPKTDETSFVLTIKSASGYRSKMEGKLRSPEQHGIVTAALCGHFGDDAKLLEAAPALLEALQGVLGITDDPANNADPEESIFAFARIAIARATSSEPSA